MLKSSESLSNLTIAIDKIDLPEDWNRTKIRKPAEIIESIQTSGQIAPLIVRVNEEKEGHVILIDGRRRLFALKELNIKEAKIAVLTNEDAGDAYLISLVSNLAREDNTAHEKVRTFVQLIDKYGKTREEIASACGKSCGYVSQHLAVLKASNALQDALKDDKINITIFRQFSRLDREEDRKIYDRLATQAIEGQASFAKIEQQIDGYLEKKNQGKDVRKKGAAAHKKTELIEVPDYNSPEVRKSMQHMTKDATVELLTYYGNELKNASKKADRRYLQGLLDGAELVCGLKESTPQ